MSTTLIPLKNQMNLREKGTVLSNLTIIVHDGLGIEAFVYIEDSEGFLVCLGTIHRYDWTWGTDELITDCIGESLVILDYHPNGMYVFGRKHLTDKLSYVKERLDREGGQFLLKIFDGYINDKQAISRDDSTNDEYDWN
jgi:hypothetical protein